MKVFFDFETRSVCDLKTAGAHVYAKDPTTDVLCLAWAVDDDEPSIYCPLDGDDTPHELLDLTECPEAEFIAHNAQFDRLIWHYVCHGKYKWPPIPLKKLYCTMVMSYSMGLMGALNNAAKCVGLRVEKDMKGNRVMLQLAKPRNVVKKDDGSLDITWWERADSKPNLDINAKYEMVYSYCKQDIIVMRELYKRLSPLDAIERQVWLLDQKINDRGVYIDDTAARNGIELAGIESKNLNERMQTLTDQQVSSCNAHTALRKWVNDQGVVADSVDKASVKDMMEIESLPNHVRKVLEIRQSAAKSSVGKLKMMLSSLDMDGRVKGCFQYHGAASTGRWASRRVQLQNMPRPSIKQTEIEEVLSLLGEV